MGLRGRGRCPWVQYDQNASSQHGHVGYHFNVVSFTEFIGGIFKAVKLFNRLIPILLLTALPILSLLKVSFKR